MTNNQKSYATNFVIGALRTLDKELLMSPGKKMELFEQKSDEIVEMVSSVLKQDAFSDEQMGVLAQ